MIAPLAALHEVTGLSAERVRWLLDGLALVLPAALLGIVDRLARRPR